MSKHDRYEGYSAGRKPTHDTNKYRSGRGNDSPNERGSRRPDDHSSKYRDRSPRDPRRQPTHREEPQRQYPPRDRYYEDKAHQMSRRDGPSISQMQSLREGSRKLESRERNRSRSRSHRRYDRRESYSRSPKPSRRRYRSRSSESYRRSRDRSYSRRSRSSSSYSADRRHAGRDSYSYSKNGARKDPRTDMKGRPQPPRRDMPDETRREKDYKDQYSKERDYRQSNEVGKYSRQPFPAKQQSKPYPAASRTDRYPSAKDQKSLYQSAQTNPQQIKSRGDTKQSRGPFHNIAPQGPFLSDPQSARAPIRIDLEQLHSAPGDPTENPRQSKHTDQKIKGEEPSSNRTPTSARPKREKDPELHSEVVKPPVKHINETDQLIHSAKALTSFRFPSSNFLMIESFRRLDGYEFELEQLNSEWRSKLEQEKSNINLLRADWLHASAKSTGNGPNQKAPMIPPRHFRLEKSQFTNSEYQDRVAHRLMQLAQLGQLIKNKARLACETSRHLVQLEVELQSLFAKRLQI